LKSSPFWLLLATCFIFSAVSRAQVTSGDILGTVTDANGAAVVHADIVVENVGTQIRRTTQTSGGGDYAVTLLDPGVYSVTISSPGFKTYTVSSLQLSAGDRARVNARLSVGQVSETVTVETQESALQTDSSVVEATISQKQTEDLPLNGRNFVQLVQLTPGVNEGNQGGLLSGAQLDDHRQSAEMTVNGQSDILNDQMIDGADNNERLIGSIGVRPSVESIAEVQVQTSDYSADVSRTGGGVINIITKSGTNRVHGSAFEYFRNDIFDAYSYDFGHPLPKNELRWNQFGGSISGPIIHDKTFFFGDFEGYRYIIGASPTVTQVPTAFEQANPGNFSDAPCSGGHYAWNCATFGSGPLDVAGAAYFGILPKPNGSYQAANGDTVPTYTASGKTNQSSNDFDIRVDHHFNNSNSMFGRFIYNRVFTISHGALPDAKLGSTGITVNPSVDSFNSLDLDYNGMLNYVHIFSPRLVLELKAGFSFNHNDSYGQNTGLNPNTALGQPNINTPLDNGTALQSILIADAGDTLGDELFEPLLDHDLTYQYLGSITNTRGAHTLKFGGSLVRRQLTSIQSVIAGGWPLFLTYPDLLQGQYPAMIFPRGQELDDPHLRVWEFGGYGEDDWHVTRRLTLNLGVRYDVYTPMTEIENRISTWDPRTESLLIAGQNGVSSTAGIQTDYHGVEPRVGFALQAAKGLVVRGGFGLSSVPSNNTAASNLKNTPFVSSVNCSFFTCGLYANGLPPIQTTQQILANPGGPLNVPGVTLLAVDPQFRSSYFEQYNLTLQKELKGNVATVSYVGIQERRGTSDFPDINEPGANPCAETGATCNANALRPYYSKYPNLSKVTEFETHGEDSYNAVQASYERRFIQGLAVNANYTYARNVGDMGGLNGVGGAGWGQQPNRLRQVDHGNSLLDIRQRFAATAIYALPFGRSAKGLEAALIKGWQYNLIFAYTSGIPFGVANPNSVSNAIPGTADRPNMSGNPNKSGLSLSQAFKTSVFSAQPAGTFGNEPMNPLHGPSYRHADMSLSKTFPLAEQWNLKFEAQAFNISNTPNFGQPGATLGTPSFGIINSMNAGYQSRTFQFALRLAF
jgi:hypothetical protein